MTGNVGQLVITVTVLVVVAWLLERLGQAILRRVRRWQLRRELRLLRGKKPGPLFALYPELEERAPRPRVRSLRTRGGDDAAA